MFKTILKIVGAVLLIAILYVGFLTYKSMQLPSEEDIRNSESLPSPTEETLISKSKKVSFNPIPSSAELVYYKDGHVFVMSVTGENKTQITSEIKREYEHVAVSPDRRFIVGDINSRSGDTSRFELWLYDLQNNTEAQLVPDFYVAGDGGVDWDLKGFIYFKCKEKKNTANADLCKIKYDGTGFRQLTNTPYLGETDVSVSEDGTLLAFGLFVPEPSRNNAHTEIWVMNSNGGGEKLVYKGGDVFKASVHDPEISPDKTRVVFSKVNSNVEPNFKNIPAANTAHDIVSVRIDGSDEKTITMPGSINMIPDWKSNKIVYTEISEKNKYQGGCIVSANKIDQLCNRLGEGVNAVRFIPSK